MSDEGSIHEDESVVTYTNIEYYDSVFDEETGALYRANIQELKDADLVIEDNTVYEIDSECYKHLARKKLRKF